MKNDKNRSNCKFILATAIFGFLLSLQSFTQTTVTETLKTEAKISSDGTLVFNNRSCNTQIKTWTNDHVELQMNVKLEGKQEDIDKTLQAIKSIKCKGSPQVVTVNTNFLESCDCGDSKHRLKLSTGEKVTLKSYSVENVLFIPATISIKIDNKYSDIVMDDIAGKADFVIYSSKLYCGSIGGFTNFDLKYSKAFLKKIPETVMKLYDSDVEMQSCGNLDLSAKYSKLQIENAGDVTFDSYDDDLKIGKLGSINGKAKYSDFDFGTSANITFDFYDCNIKMGETGNVKGQGKYSEIVGKKALKLTLNSSFDDSYTFDELDSFDCLDSKYSNFNVGLINQGLNIISYDDIITVDKFSNTFTGIKFEAKYSDFIFSIPDNIACRLVVEMKYGKVDYPESQFINKTFIKENEQLKIEAHTKNGNENAPCKIELKGYDSKIIIRN